MQLLVDAHIHTVASGHAYSTIQEYAQEASKKGLEMIAMTDHGVKLPGAPHIFHFWNMKVIPNYINGVRILRGAEVNILDGGKLDLPGDVLERLDLVIVSMHDVCIKPGNAIENTNNYIKAMQNPYVDIIGHSGNPVFPIDIDMFTDAAKEYNKIIEINNSSLRGGVREGSREVCKEIIKACIKKGIYISTSTDAHISYDVGKFDEVLGFIKEIGVPEELILSTSKNKFIDALNLHNKELQY